MAITSLIFGITSIILSFIPGIGVVSVVTILFSLIFGIINLVRIHRHPEKNESKAPSVAGISLSLVALVITSVLTALIYFGVTYFLNYEDSFTELLKEKEVVEGIVEEENSIEAENEKKENNS